MSATIPHATALSFEALTGAVADVYRELIRVLSEQHRHAVRIWNFVPGIQTEMDGGDRYMAFNAGRFAAYTALFGDVDLFSAVMPTASAVGVDGETLWVHVLTANAAGVAIENPRQIPAFHYSRRYGLRPPCFARATRLGSELLIGGTASILGEDSMHRGDITAQTHETLANIATLIATAKGVPAKGPLRTLSNVRIHVKNGADAARVDAVFQAQTAPGCRVEYVQADLCRQDLLVEIEGTASTSDPRN